MKLLHTFMKHPWTTLVVGLILLGTSGYEVWVSFREAEEIKLGAHHGVFFYGLAHSLKSIPEIFEGAEQVGI